MEEYDHREEYKIELGLALVSHEDYPSASHDHKLHILFPPHPLLKEEQRMKRSRILDEGDGASHDSYTRKKLRLTQEQTTLLEDSFREHNTLTTKQVLAEKLDLKPRQVEVWFQSKRAGNKLKQTEVDFQLLKKWSEILNAENRRLKRELQGMKQQPEGSGSALCLDLPKVISGTTKLTRCSSCGKSRMASVKRICSASEDSSVDC